MIYNDHHNIHHARHKQNKTNDVLESQLLQTLLSDNKKVSHELEIQLETIETLQKQNDYLKQQMNDMYVESTLYLERDELNMKRNASLIRENKELKRKVKELERTKKEFEERLRSMKQDCESQKKDIIWNNETLDMKVIKLEADLRQSDKEKRWLLDEIKRLKELASALG